MIVSCIQNSPLNEIRDFRPALIGLAFAYVCDCNNKLNLMKVKNV